MAGSLMFATATMSAILWNIARELYGCHLVTRLLSETQLNKLGMDGRGREQRQ